MSVKFFTANPNALLKEFMEKITQEEKEGSITTWEITSTGSFTHKGQQYAREAFFRADPQPENKTLLFKIVRPEGKNISQRAYGYYHGHLIETFLNHFDKKFVSASASAMPADGDNVQG
ncbi:hypothetical protein [Pseudomonas sp. LFS044]|uniref:hypothetical protein n=1 Tax=Pseudomonas sp. LFS044 TaxID=3229880 RepID=UPI003A80F06D